MSVVGAGAFAFGAVIGWNLYLINRYRSGTVQLSDLVTLIGAVGGAAVLKLFPADTDLFGWYGLGLAFGFFAYFIVLLIMVRLSGGSFTVTWFLDGRRKLPPEGWTTVGAAPTVHPLEDPGKKKPPE
jgi:hypothetical protein